MGVACRGPSAPPTEAGPHPNWIVILPDSLRADRLEEGGWGADAPAMHALARRGMRFENAFSQGGWTAPGLTAFLTGQYPPALEVGERTPFLLPLGSRTLPEILRIYGYRTAAFWNDTFPATVEHYDRGFDEVYRSPRAERPFGTDVEAWLRNTPPEPFFVLVHEVDFHPRLVHDATGHGTDLAPAARTATKAISAYDAAVRRYDDVVDELLETLDDTGLRARTIVVLTSNHGEDLAEHNPTAYHGFLYDSCLRIPLVVDDPAASVGARRIPTVVQSVDIAPTVLERSGIPVDRQMDGHSLVPILEGREGYPERAVFSLTNPLNASLRTRDRKLVLCGGKKTVCRDGRASPTGVSAPGRAGESGAELYDLTVDPGERENRYDADPDVARRMRGALELWLDAQRRRADAEEPQADPAALRSALDKWGYWGLVTQTRDGPE